MKSKSKGPNILAFMLRRLAERSELQRLGQGGGWISATALAIVGSLAPSPAMAAVFWVGQGAGCTHSNVAAAVLSAALTPEADTIVLTRSTTYTGINLTLTNWNPATVGALSLLGGVDTCGGPVVGGTTSLVGIGGNPVITVETSGGGVSEVNLTNLELSGGSRGLDASGATEVEVLTSILRANGNGARVTAGAQVSFEDSTIHDNSGGLFGGGILCRDSGSVVRLYGLSIVTGNAATSAGGGIFAADSCVVLLYQNALILSNDAQRGGGVYLQSGAVLQTDPLFNVDLGLAISHNRATDLGGGVFVNGAVGNTVAALRSVQVNHNVAVNGGGGIAVTAGGTVYLHQWPSEHRCSSWPRCTSLSHNRVSHALLGSAALATSGATLHIGQAYVEGNSGRDEGGGLIEALDAGTDVRLEGLQIWNNRAHTLFAASGTAALRVAFVSAARNSYAVAAGYAPSSGGGAWEGSALRLYSSILADISAFVTVTGGTVHGDCLVVDTAAGLTTSTGVPMVGVDPRFRQPDVGNLRLRFDSPAIDSCDDFAYTPMWRDYDLDLRGDDLSFVPNVLGPFDRGVDEVAPIFADGFESGATDEWSATGP